MTDAIAKGAVTGVHPWGSLSSADRAGDILSQLHRILSSCRGGNKRLISMLCKKIAELQSGHMLLTQPSDRIIDAEDSSEQWPAGTANNLNGQMSFEAGMDLRLTNEQAGFRDQTVYQEEVAVQNFVEDLERNDLSPSNSSISSHSNLPPGISQIPSSPQQLQPSLIPYNLWNVQTATNTDPNSIGGLDATHEATRMYAQLQQDFNGSFSIDSLENFNELDHFPVQNGDIWADSAMEIGNDGLDSTLEAVEQWN